MSRVKADSLQQSYNRSNLFDILGAICSQLNGFTEGRIENRHNALTAAPTTGTYMQGDFIANSAPSEAGTVGGKYIVIGWICTVSGEPGTFKDARVLTGN